MNWKAKTFIGVLVAGAVLAVVLAANPPPIKSACRALRRMGQAEIAAMVRAGGDERTVRFAMSAEGGLTALAGMFVDDQDESRCIQYLEFKLGPLQDRARSGDSGAKAELSQVLDTLARIGKANSTAEIKAIETGRN